jgi:hypothetical protein
MKKSGVIADYLYVLKIIRTASPFRILLTIAMEIIGNGFNIFYRVIFIAYFMGSIESNQNFRRVLAVLIGVVILNIIFEIISS